MILSQVEALDVSDKFFLGNVDKKWKKEDVNAAEPLATNFFILYFCEIGYLARVLLEC